MTESSEHSKEQKALDALMAAAFRAEDADSPVTEEEARAILENSPVLSPEDEKGLAGLGPDFVDNLLVSADTDTSALGERRQVLDREIEDAYAAMHRGKEGEELDEKSRREIEKKRRELLGEPESGNEKEDDRP